MATITFKNIPGESGLHFYHEEQDLLFQRIIAGISYPGQKPGVVCVLGEVSSWRPPFQVHWLAEDEQTTLDSLIDSAIQLKADFKITDFYGQANSEDAKRFLKLFNREQREKRMPTMEILAAPYSNTSDIASHINILRNRLHSDKKSLHLGASKIMPGALQEIAVDELASATDADYPAVAALGYGVAALTEWDYNPPGNRTKSFARKDYDVLNYE